MSFVRQTGGGALDAIREIIVPPAGQTQIDFQDIPQNFRDLMLRVVVRMSGAGTGGADTMYIILANDTSNSYGWVQAPSNAATTSGIDTSSGQVTVACGTSAINDYSYVDLTFPDYTSFYINKTWTGQSYLPKLHAAGSPSVISLAGSYYSQNRIAAMTLTANASDGFAAGTVATLYGVAAPGQLPLIPQQGGSLVALQEIGPLRAGQSSFIFSNIPQNYRHLRILGQVRTANLDGNTIIYGQFNAGGTYDNLYSYADSATHSGVVNSVADTNAVLLHDVLDANAPAGQATSFCMDVENYTSALFWKTARVQSIINSSGAGSTGSGPMQEQRMSSQWRSTAPLTDLTFSSSSGNFDVGSVMTLYGIAPPDGYTPAVGVATRTVTANTTAGPTDQVILVNATAGAVTVTLPNYRTCNKRVTVKKIDASANVVTIAATSTETIDGAATQTISSRWVAIEVASDQKTGWYIV